MRSSRSSFAFAFAFAFVIGCGDESAPGGATTTGAGGETTTGIGGAGGAGGSGASGGSGGSGGCTSPLPQETLDALQLGLVDHWQAQPGDSIDFDVGVPECCYVLTDVGACVAFSVAPADAATIDAATGVLGVSPTAAPGTVLTVTADVEQGRRVLEAKVTVYTPETNPLVRAWSEESQLACAGGAQVTPEQAMGELMFWADGSFWATWTPFELYVDYWGTYTFDLGTGALTITPEGGNYVPPDVDGTGTFTVAAGLLTLNDVWLGTPQGGVSPANCGHVFH